MIQPLFIDGAVVVSVSEVNPYRGFGRATSRPLWHRQVSVLQRSFLFGGCEVGKFIG